MEKKILLTVVVAGILVLGVVGVCLAGIEPVPWEPEINKLHSIELNIAAIEKRMVKLSEFKTLPEGAGNYLDAMGNQLGVLDTRLADTLILLDPFSQLDTETKDQVGLSLGAIREDAYSISSLIDIFERMGIEPVPWRGIVDSIIGGIDRYMGRTDTLPK